MGRVDTEADLGEVRHSIDVTKLENYLCKKCPDDFSAPFVIKQFGFGQSNPSYQIKDAKGRKYVLRKQPPGKLVSKTAHRVDREFYMMKALYPAGIPVPRVIDLCEDKSVIGVMFYMMEFVANGRIFHDPTFPELSAKDRRECWESAITTLAQLHSLDPRDLDLPASFLKNPLQSHYPRQLVTLGKVAEAQAEVVSTKTGEKVGMIPNFGDISKWLSENMPPERVGVVHGDYKIDNLIFHATENRVIAMLDWELCTIGHPLADLGNLLMPYSTPPSVQPGNSSSSSAENSVSGVEGMPSLNQHFALYEKHAGWNPKQYWTFAKVYSNYRLSVIVHGIKARDAVGQASSENAAKHALAVPIFAKLAMDAIINSNKTKL